MQLREPRTQCRMLIHDICLSNRRYHPTYVGASRTYIYHSLFSSNKVYGPVTIYVSCFALLDYQLQWHFFEIISSVRGDSEF